MDVFGLEFNMGNVFGLPLILGAAAEYGLNVVMRFMEGREHGGPLIARRTVMAVLVNGLTTIVGFGSLMLADHRGIFGLGLLLTLGTAASLDRRRSSCCPCSCACDSAPAAHPARAHGPDPVVPVEPVPSAEARSDRQGGAPKWPANLHGGLDMRPQAPQRSSRPGNPRGAPRERAYLGASTGPSTPPSAPRRPGKPGARRLEAHAR